MGDTSTASDNGQDDDCDGLVDDADEDCLPCDEDADGDGFTDASCSGGGDCDDTSAEIHPFAFEGTARCFDGLDNDCDGAVDADDPGCTAEGICSVDGWCWENPLPQGNWLSGIHAFADDDVWAVGDVGTVLRWDGEAWSALDTGSREHLFGIWGSGPDDVWVSGAGGALLHYDGASWSGQAGESFAEALRAIWGSDPNNIWVGGDEGAMRRFDGETWTPVPFPGRGTVHDIWGSGPDDVWAVGGIDTCSPCVTRWFIAHFDGEAWSLHDHGQSDGLGGFMLTGIAGSAPDHVITVGRDGVAWRFDGGAWLAERSDSGLELSGVEVTPDGSAIAVGSRGVVARYDAGTEAWSTLRAAEQGAAWLSGAGALPSGDVWLVGARGAILRARRGALEEISHDAARGGTLRGIWGFDDEAAWAVGDGGALLRREGQRWSAVEVEGAPSLRAIWGSSPQDIWVGGGALLHFDGEAWRPFEGERPEGAVDAWGVSLDDAWMLTERALWRWDGEAWTEAEAGFILAGGASLWGASWGDLWLGTDGGTLAHVLDGEWARLAGASGGTYGLHGLSIDEVYAAGEGDVRRWDGAEWREVYRGGRFRGIWVSAKGTAWASGEVGLLRGRRFGVWSPQIESGTRNDLHDVWGGSTSAFWVVGEGGAILRWRP